jgi:hypothetical protein
MVKKEIFSANGNDRVRELTGFDAGNLDQTVTLGDFRRELARPEIFLLAASTR